MSTVPCWRCHSRGFLGYLPGGAPLICRVCHGAGHRHVEIKRNAGRVILRRSRHYWRGYLTSKWWKVRRWWHGFVERNWICDEKDLPRVTRKKNPAL